MIPPQNITPIFRQIQAQKTLFTPRGPFSFTAHRITQPQQITQTACCSIHTSTSQDDRLMNPNQNNIRDYISELCVKLLQSGVIVLQRRVALRSCSLCNFHDIFQLQFKKRKPACVWMKSSHTTRNGSSVWILIPSFSAERSQSIVDYCCERVKTDQRIFDSLRVRLI